MRYRSKVSILVMAILGIVFLLPLVWGIFLLIHPATVGLWFVFFTFVLVDVFLFILIFPTDYEIAPPLLRIRSGVMRVNIPLISIQHVFPDHSLGKPGGLSFALSLDRLRVDYLNEWGGAAFVYIAPKDKGRFMQELATKTPYLEFNGGHVIPRR